MRCLNCDQLFYNRLAKDPKYCSQACRREYERGVLPSCKECGQAYSLATQGKYRPYCSRLCAEKNRRKLTTRPATLSKHTRWANAVKDRDGHRCRRCGSDYRIEAHHLAKRPTHPELKYDINNGVTLCWRCHRWVDQNPAAAERQGWQRTRKGGPVENSVRRKL